MNYLFDTCVISELVAKSPNPEVVRWVRSLPEERVYLSVITAGEIKKGIEKLPECRRKDEISTWLYDELLPRFTNRLVALDADILLAWGSLTARLEVQGKTMPAIDSLIAASAIWGGFTLATRNVADFEWAGVRTFSPWAAP